MEMHQIRYFLAAAKALNFTRAAEQCHVSQPALTTAVKRLEELLGSPLFHRDGRRLGLTDFGRRMQPHLEQILEQTAAAEALAKDFRLLNQVPIRLGVMSTIGPTRLASLFAAFACMSWRRYRGDRCRARYARLPARRRRARHGHPQPARWPRRQFSH